MLGPNREFHVGWVMRLILINVVVFVIQIFTFSQTIPYSIAGAGGSIPLPWVTYYFGLIPSVVLSKGFIWQLFTYMFLHATSTFAHIFFNMYALLIFGIPIEQTWGSRKFLFYYFFCGAGAGLSIFLINLINGGVGFYIPTIGASGAVFGLLLAFGLLYPNAEILLFFILPIKAKYLVILYGGLELYLELFGGQSNISHIGHLGGLFFGLLYFYFMHRRSITFKTKIFRAKISEKRKELSSSMTDEKKGSAERDKKVSILRKLKAAGYDSLTDDEVQYVKYQLIMNEDDETICDEEDFNIDDDYCLDCDKIDYCFIREVKKYIKN